METEPTVDGSWVDNRGYQDMLHSCGSFYRYGGNLEESLRRSATGRELWTRADALKTSRRES